MISYKCGEKFCKSCTIFLYETLIWNFKNWTPQFKFLWILKTGWNKLLFESVVLFEFSCFYLPSPPLSKKKERSHLVMARQSHYSIGKALRKRRIALMMIVTGFHAEAEPQFLVLLPLRYQNKNNDVINISLRTKSISSASFNLNNYFEKNALWPFVLENETYAE